MKKNFLPAFLLLFLALGLFRASRELKRQTKNIPCSGRGWTIVPV